jgi:type 1 fimbria pilin
MTARKLAAAFLAAAAISASVPAADDAEVALTGEVIDSACYIKSGARGESHRVCAQKCGDAGIPLALVVEGTDAVVWLASVDDMETPNAKLRPFAGRRVTVTGVWAERGGAKILLLHSVKAAPKT